MSQNDFKDLFLREVDVFERAFATTLRAYSNLADLKISYQGTQASTYQHHITLPNVRVIAGEFGDKALAEAQAYLQAVRGYGWREVARLVDTDTRALDAFARSDGSFARAVLGIFDDIRIEERSSIAAEGAKEALLFLRDWIWKRDIEEKKQSKEVGWLSEIAAALQCLLKHDQEAPSQPIWLSLDSAVQSFAERHREHVDRAFDAIKQDRTKATERLIDVTRFMLQSWAAEYEAVVQFAPETPVKAPVPELKIEKAEEETATDDAVSNAAIAALLTATRRCPLLFVTLASRPSSLTSQRFAGGFIQRVEPVSDEISKLSPGEWRTLVLHPPDPEIERALNDALAEILEAAYAANKALQKRAEEQADEAMRNLEQLPDDQQPYLVYSTANDKIEKLSEASGEEYKRLEDAVTASVGVLKHRLEVLLRSRTQTRTIGRQDEGFDLDPEQMSEIAIQHFSPNHEVKPFQIRKVSADCANTVVGLLIDESGSMHGEKMELAKQTAICFGDALALAQFRFAVWGFTSNAGEDYPEGEKSVLYARLGGLVIDIVKNFDESWLNTKHRAGNLGWRMGANYDADSVQYAVAKLLEQRATRRVLFVASDGQPHGGEDDIQIARQHHQLKRVVSSAENAGVEIVAIGIVDESVKKYYRKAAVLSRAQDLPGFALGAMSDLLLPTRR